MKIIKKEHITHTMELGEFCCDEMREAYPLTVNFISHQERMTIRDETTSGTNYLYTINFCPFCGEKIEVKKWD